MTRDEIEQALAITREDELPEFAVPSPTPRSSISSPTRST